jgi:hypothetical protein
MAGDAAPAATRSAVWPARAARRTGAFLVTAVFGFGLVTAAALVALGAVLVLGLGMTTAGVVVGGVGVVAGLGFAVSQGAVH